MLSGLDNLTQQCSKYCRAALPFGSTAGPAALKSMLSSPRKGQEDGAVSKDDSLLLGTTLQALRDSGVDLEHSRLDQDTTVLDFDLHFEDQEIHQLSSSGQYDLHAQSLQMDLSFQAPMTVTDPETGEKREGVYQFDFHLEAIQVDATWTDATPQKQDVLQFANNLVNGASRAQDEGKDINGLSLGKEDLDRLGAGDIHHLAKTVVGIIDLMRKLASNQGDESNGMGLNLDRGQPQASDASPARENQKAETSFSLALHQVFMEMSIETPQSKITTTMAVQTGSLSLEGNPGKRSLLAIA